MLNKSQQKSALRAMRNNVHDHVDECREVNMTTLAEWACAHLNLWEGPHVDETPEELFELSFKVSEEWDKRPW
jgi:hypothetical protein